VVQTKSFVDKDLYGKPGMIYLHEGGVQAMATDLKAMLSDDFTKNLNKKLYEENAVQTRHGYCQSTEQDWREMNETMKELPIRFYIWYAK
jgi:hypothetical protein